MNQYIAFALLKPASVAVARDGDVKSVKNLRQAVRQVVEEERKEDGADGWTSCINDLKEYLVFPLILHLKSGKKITWSLQEEIVKCLCDILQFSIIEEFKFFQELFTQLFLILTDRGDPQKVGNVSEECKETALETISIMMNNISNDIRENIYGDRFRPQLGHAVFICLKLVKEEKNRRLRIQAMEALSSLGQKRKYEALIDSQQMMLSHTFANFLPGIVTALAKVATGDEKQGHKITVLAVSTWSYFVTLVMRDSFLEQQVTSFGDNKTVMDLKSRLFGADNNTNSKERKTETNKSSRFDLPEPDEETSSPKLPNVELSNDWIQGTANKLMLLVQSMAKLVTHSHWGVRLSLVEWAQQIVCKCSRSLEGSLVMAIEVVVTLRSDDVVEVGTAAQDALLTIMQVLDVGKNHDDSRQQGLMELLEEKVFALSSQLPTIFRQEDDTRSLATLRQLHGCLEVLGERLGQIMMWPSHSQRLFRALAYMLTLDARESDLLLEKNNAHDPFELLNLKPTLGRSFRYFSDNRIFETLSSTCLQLGCHCDVKIITDLCLDLLQETTQHQKEVLLLLTLLFQGRDRRKWKEKDKQFAQPEENEEVVRSVIDLITYQEILEAPLYISSQSKVEDEDTIKNFLVPVNTHRNMSVDIAKNNIILVASALNLICACAHMLGTDFIMFLNKILCPVMEKAGESNVLVGHTANNTLKEIARACEFGSISELIEKSVANFWYQLSMRLKRLPQYPSAPLVLQVCLEYANVDVMAFTGELVEDVLLSCDTYHNTQALPLLRVLLVYVTAVKKYESRQIASNTHKDVENKTESINVQQARSEASQNPGDLVDFLINYHKTKMEIKEGLKENDNEEVDIPQEELGEAFKQNEEEYEDHTVSDEKKQVPKYIELVVNILERCSHLLYTNDRQIKILILEVARVGTEALRQWEDERLPVLHKLWKPLVLRLKDTDFVVMMRAFQVLSTMMITSGDFLQKRTLKEVFPPLLLFLKNQNFTSLGKSQRSGYYMTSAYKAQCTLLDNLITFVTSMNLRVIEMSELLSVLVLYLDSRQPSELSRRGYNLMKQVAEKHPHQVWLVLAFQQPPMRIIPPSPNLPEIKISGSASRTLIPEAVNLYEQLS